MTILMGQGLLNVIVEDATNEIKEGYDRSFLHPGQVLDLVAHIRQLEKDAARYRWLRDEAQWENGVPQAIIWSNEGHVQEICAEEELDTAIDIAMQAKP